SSQIYRNSEGVQFDVYGYCDKVNPFLLNSYGVLVLFVHLPRAALRLHGVIQSQLLRSCFNS
ncbi:MAG: hypothetical protein LBQ50_04085, partial [Planctomycetaceae bacterium]|nr:hypothetical protein [Planctomycetaceae bacterium]